MLSGIEERDKELNKLKGFIVDNIDQLQFGLFFTRNIINDPIVLKYRGKYFYLWVDWQNGYTELFGLSAEEQKKMTAWYNKVVEKHRNEE